MFKPLRSVLDRNRFLGLDIILYISRCTLHNMHGRWNQFILENSSALVNSAAASPSMKATTKKPYGESCQGDECKQNDN